MDIKFFPFDIICYILKFVRDREKIHFLSICKRLHALKNRFLYNTLIPLKNILHISYYDQFTHIKATGDAIGKMKELKMQFPKNTKSLVLIQYRGYFKTILSDLKFLTHLSIKKKCKVTVKPGCIPQTITHLTWECNHELIEGILPNGLISLRVDYYTHAKIILPPNLQHLHIGRNFNYHNNYDPNQIALPISLKVLELDNIVPFTKDDIPSNVKKIIFGKCYNYASSLFLKIPDTLESCICWDNWLVPIIAEAYPFLLEIKSIHHPSLK